MADGPATKAAILGVLADVSPSGQARSSALTVSLDWFHWLPAQAVGLFVPPMTTWPPRSTEAGAHGDNDRRSDMLAPGLPAELDRRVGERLASIDRIRPGDRRSLRAGWLFVAGRRRMPDGRRQRVFHPLLSVPVKVSLPILGDALVEAVGDVSITALISDRSRRHELEASYELGGGALSGLGSPEIDAALLRRLARLHQFAAGAAREAGFDTSRLVPVAGRPEQHLAADSLVIVAGVGLYTATDVGGLSPSDSLRSWAVRPGPSDDAFDALYLGPAGASPAEAELEGEVLAPFPLTPAQRRAVVLTRTSSVSVVSGAAGNGKSHTVSAIACDAVARAESVLVAAKSDAAVDALLVLLADAPGPAPVVFGSSERREELARRLASGELAPAAKDELAAALAAVRAAAAERTALTSSIVQRLRAESRFGATSDAEDGARVVAPGLFDPRCDEAEVRELLATAGRTGWWWVRRRSAKALSRARSLAGAADSCSAAELAGALDLAVGSRVLGDLLAAGGLDLGEDWTRLEAADAELHRRVGEWLALEARSPERLNRTTLAAVAVLATALRSGRAARRAQLAGLDERLTRALPLWVGTLGDIEDLLPPRSGLFDLVILDEASAVDQPLAAPALLRARRAVVVGDPHQLRHVSFLADDQLRRSAAEHGLGGDPVLLGLLDVRRNSIFDVAVAASPATVLDEHFRSAPHLFDFVAHRLYGGRVKVATRSPATASCDCVEVVRLQERRDEAGVVRKEVDAVVERLRRLLGQGVRSVGVVSPFRAQADALEASVLETFSIADIEALDLRVGTVHAFQGNERDIVIVSVGIGLDDGAGSWRFVEDPHLFAVLATRARNRLVLLLSAEPPAGLLADYVAQADAPPGPPRPAGVPRPWHDAVVAGLAAAGIPATPSYPSGRHTVDVCAGDDRRFLALECSVHPGGPAAHVERHLALRRAGWKVSGAFASRWAARPGELFVDVKERLAAPDA